MSDENRKALANPMIVLREEFDEWALLFDPDTNNIFAVDPVSVYIWKRLNGKHTQGEILKELLDDCDGVPEDAPQHIANFVGELIKNRLAEYEANGKKG